ncbi:MAG: 3-isopropylmalate dehydratase large subunit [Candidatus Methylomirabilales bacterium]
MTLAERILARAAGKPSVQPGEIIVAKVDCAMLDDILGPRVQIAEEMARLGAEIWDPGKVVVVLDHYFPAANAAQAEILAFTRAWAAARKVTTYDGLGPCHQLLAEKGHCRPGSLLVGTDSHTCTAGAFGCFGTGIGSTEMLGVLVEGEIWLKVPETIRASWDGQLAPGVMAKDMALKTIGALGHAGATYKVLEYAGSTVRALSLDSRMCLTNMAVESGAKTGLIAPDDKVQGYFAEIGVPEVELLAGDADAPVAVELTFDAASLRPQVACPSEVDRVQDVRAVQGVRIDQAYLGSCTGGRLEDLAAAADILKTRHVAPQCRLLVSPASQDVWRRASRAGVLDILAEAGAVVMAPTCGACVGLHSGVLAAGEVCVSTTNRNFVGRMGSKQAKIYLASPATVAASAVRGTITDPTELWEGRA